MTAGLFTASRLTEVGHSLPASHILRNKVAWHRDKGSRYPSGLEILLKCGPLQVSRGWIFKTEYSSAILNTVILT